MRKRILIGMSFMIAVIVVLLIGHKIYTPLSKIEYEAMFSKIGEMNLLYGEDAVHLDPHGDIVEYYVYKAINCEMDSDFPSNIQVWDRQLINKECLVMRWSQISKDTLHVLNLWECGEQSFRNIKYKEDFSLALADTNNYFSLIQFDELRHYLFVFDPCNECLYYYRVCL